MSLDEAGRIRRLLLKGAVAGLCVGAWPSPTLAQDGEFRALPKAMWVWLKSLDELDALSRFALDYRFSALMIHFRKPARAELLDPALPALRILRDLKSHGCACFALAGEPQWAEQARLPRTVADLLELQRRHLVFDGLHLDVEPHSLALWRQPGGQTTLMQGVADLAQRARKAMPSKMSLQLALNPKYALQELAAGEDFLDRIAPHVQEVSLMAYRDTPPRQIQAAEAAVARLQSLKLAWRMGVLSNPPKEPGVSYHGLQRPAFEAHMQNLWQDLKSESLCQGLIFENYHSLRTLLQPIAT
ncbi:MAG TPA: hypothetical protein VIQ01_06325 [Burkholderiales bacterium]